MNRRKQLKRLFDQLCGELELNNFNENFDYNKKSLKLDFNSVYGGYIINTITGNGSTGEGFYIFSSRMELKEIIALIQGIIHGLNSKKYD
jgi:hypothetical protein|tara:strand:+ start:19281 stop:19550 length:270 start_codon:yes stop_codon:yes gene_type:complete